MAQANDLLVNPLQANYSHATLYTFNTKARAEVVRRFHAVILDVSAKCWYDADTHAFLLTCPNVIGDEANQALASTIADYISEELERAEFEDRWADVTLCPQYSLDGAGVFQPTGAIAAPLVEPTTLSNQAPIVSNEKPPTFHHVSVENPNATLMLFSLRALPAGFLERTLTSSTQSKKTIQYGLSCRGVRWNDPADDWLFNGRFGSTLDEDEYRDSTIAKAPGFLQLYDLRPSGSLPEENVGQTPSSHFRFVGEIPSVQKFLEGYGHIEPDLPDAMPEMPPDAREFKEHSLSHTAATRARVPKSFGIASYSDDEEQSDEEVSFHQLMTRHSRKDHNVTRNVSFSSSDNDTEDEGEGISFDQLMGKKTLEPTSPSSQPIPELGQLNKPQVHNPQNLKENESSLVPNPQGPARSDVLQGDGIPSYSRNYAVVDKTGLTCPPVSQATWEHEAEIHSPRRTKTDGSGISRRQPSEISRSVSGSARPASVMSDFNALGSIQASNLWNIPQPWEGRVARPQPPQGQLIDDTAPPSTTKVKHPPGLPPPGLEDVREGAYPPSCNLPTNISTKDPPTGTLIDLSEGGNAAPPVRMPSMATSAILKPSQPLSTKLSTQPSVPEEEDEDEMINERLQYMNYDQFMKRYTMRQKAQKKKKAKKSSARDKSKSSSAKAALELPDPVPPPKPKRVTEETKSTDNVNADNTKGATNSLQPNENEDADEFTPASRIGKFLQDLSRTQNLTAMKIAVHFGVILVRKMDNKEFFQGVENKQVVEKKLHQAGESLRTDFLPRLTTSSVDAEHILRMVSGSNLHAKIEYEIHIKTIEGKPLIIRFDQARREAFEIAVPEEKTRIGTLFIHFPVRVFDAQVTVNDLHSDDALSAAISSFISSIHTLDSAPSFQALYPLDSFTIHNVCIKRSFTKQDSRGFDLEVTEVQDLVLESSTSARYNIKATAMQTQTMVENQRLWWECCLRLRDKDLAVADVLASVVDEMVSEMDCVGVGNVGPWERAENEKAEASVEQPAVPWW